MDGPVEPAADGPLWWTLRRPLHPLSYPAAYRMLQRVNAMIGANRSLHDLSTPPPTGWGETRGRH